ncbi:MAG: hypothetical protein AB8C46_22315 [Burkholderiaceae bacterium]
MIFSSKSHRARKLRRTTTLMGAGLALVLPMTVLAGPPAEVLEYYWPDHQKSLTFKAKSHAFRGTLQLDPGSEVNIGGQTYRALQLSAKRLKPVDKVIYLRAGEQGLFRRYSKAEQSPETLELKLPARAGDEWETVDRDGKPSTRRVESVGDCKVRGKAFTNCITVNFESKGMPAIAVFAPGYGEVVNSQINGFVYRELALQSP